MPFTRVATLAEVPPGTCKQVVVEGRRLALFNVDGQLHALDDVCPHRGAPLSEGELDGNEVICPWHDARFDVTTGAHLCPPARSDVATHRVQVIGNDIQVEVS